MLVEPAPLHPLATSTLQSSPIRVTLHSAKMVKRIVTMARDPVQRGQFAPVKVAVLKDSMFIVDGHAMVEGCRLAGVDTVNALVHKVESIDDVLALHLKSNYHSPLNPFKIIDVINFMLERGEHPSQIVQKLQLGEHLTKLIGCRIINREAKIKLDDFIEKLSSKYSNVVIPPYFAELVCKLPQKIQSEVVEQFIAIMDTTLPDRKFAFPGPETLEIYFKQYLKNKEREPVFFREETQNAASSAKTSHSVALTAKEMEYANIIGAVPGMALLKVEKPGLYRVNLIKKIISPIRDEKEFTVIEGDEGKKIFALPKNASEFLDIDESDVTEVAVKTFTTTQLKKFAAKMSGKKDRFVVVWSRS
jgi:hypothetical protein